jgi:hypothetical protein
MKPAIFAMLAGALMWSGIAVGLWLSGWLR